MEERLNEHISVATIITCIMVVVMAVFIAAANDNNTEIVLDRIEQLEADLDRMERTNKGGEKPHPTTNNQ